jgi:excisionase family DNA binding protein
MSKVQQSTTWLRLGEAAEYLGVHPATLRRWADEGRLACLRTPGGRRRFAQADLDSFMASLRGGASPSFTTAITPMPSSPMMDASTHASIRDQGWYGQLDEDHRSMLRGQGQKLMATLMHYISRDEGDAYLKEGERLAAGYASLFLRNGLGLVDVLNAFLIVRRSITSSLHEARHTQSPMDQDAWRLYHRTEDFLDRVLMAMIGIYENAGHE